MHVAIFGVSFLPHVGGMEYAIHYLASALVDHGVRVTVVVRRSSGNVHLPHRYDLLRYGLPFRGGYRMRINRWSGRRVLAALHTREPLSVANLHSVAEGPEIALPFLKAHGIPIVMTPHGEDVQRVPSIGYGMRLDPRWDRVVSDNLRHADVITTISESIRRDLPADVVDRAYPIPNGIAPGVFSPGHSRFLHRKLGLADDARLIVSVGRNHIKKGYADGIAAFATAVRKGALDGWFYALVGNNVATLADVVDRHGMRDRVFLVGQLGAGELRECYRSATIFFSPSIIEGFSLVSIEAMACGLPLVVTDVPGNADVVADNHCGIIVPAQDPARMADGLQAMAADESGREGYARAAAQSAVKYEWSAVAQRYIDAYERAIRSSRARAMAAAR
jgi:glycosyltransferase involved in cell wall biosynthesis